MSNFNQGQKYKAVGFFICFFEYKYDIVLFLCLREDINGKMNI